MLEDVYRAGDTDFSAQIARVQALDPQPDVIFIAAVPNEAGITTAARFAAGLVFLPHDADAAQACRAQLQQPAQRSMRLFRR